MQRARRWVRDIERASGTCGLQFNSAGSMGRPKRPVTFTSAEANGRQRRMENCPYRFPGCDRYTPTALLQARSADRDRERKEKSGIW